MKTVPMKNRHTLSGARRRLRPGGILLLLLLAFDLAAAAVPAGGCVEAACCGRCGPRDRAAQRISSAAGCCHEAARTACSRFPGDPAGAPGQAQAAISRAWPGAATPPATAGKPLAGVALAPAFPFRSLDPGTLPTPPLFLVHGILKR